MSLTTAFTANAHRPGSMPGASLAPETGHRTDEAASDAEAADAARRERVIENRELFDHGIVGRGYNINHQYASGQHGAHNRDQSRRQGSGAAQMQNMMMGAAWGQQTIQFGDLEMTNDEALDNLDKILTNRDYFNRWAKENGHNSTELHLMAQEMSYLLNLQKSDIPLTPEQQARLDELQKNETLGGAMAEATQTWTRDAEAGVSQKTAAEAPDGDNDSAEYARNISPFSERPTTDVSLETERTTSITEMSPTSPVDDDGAGIFPAAEALDIENQFNVAAAGVPEPEAPTVQPEAPIQTANASSNDFAQRGAAF